MRSGPPVQRQRGCAVDPAFGQSELGGAWRCDRSGEIAGAGGVRETLEETGIECEFTGLVGIYTDPKHVILYTSNGEVRQEFSILLTARATGGAPTPSDESSEVRWVAREALGGYAMDRSMRLRIEHFLEGRARPYLG